MMNKLAKSQASVHDPFAHAQSLMKNEEEITFEKKYYAKIVGMKAMLSNISNDHLMTYIQNDISILTALYEIACRDKSFTSTFEYLYHSWVGSLTMTRARDGKERDLQATPGSQYMPKQQFAGYGEDLDYIGEYDDGGGGLMDNIPRLPRPRIKRPDYRV